MPFIWHLQRSQSLPCSRLAAVFEILDSQDFTGARMKSCLQESLFLWMQGMGKMKVGWQGKIVFIETTLMRASHSNNNCYKMGKAEPFTSVRLWDLWKQKVCLIIFSLPLGVPTILLSYLEVWIHLSFTAWDSLSFACKYWCPLTVL